MILRTLFILYCLGNGLSILAQPIRIAILDFDNISGITKYDGLGKAMSSMLISDIESNVSPKRLQLVERAQIQKILREQNFQASSNVNKATAVQAGKLLGVSYLLVGDVYILNDQLVINARLTNTETGDIVFSKKQEGNTNGWLTLKTNVAKDLATSLSQPFNSPTIPDIQTPVATLTTYGNAIKAKDEGDLAKAENLIETVREFTSDFKYLDDLQNEIESIKKEMQKMQVEIETVVENPIKAAYNFFVKENYIEAIKYFQIGLKRIPDSQFGSKYAYYIFLAEAFLKNKNYTKALEFCDSILQMNPFEPAVVYTKALAFSSLNQGSNALKLLDEYYKNKDSIGNGNIILKKIFLFSQKNRNIILNNLKIEHNSGSTIFSNKIQYDNYEEFIQQNFRGWAPSKIFKITSDVYPFFQEFNFKKYVSLYTTTLENLKYDAGIIASIIENLKVNEAGDLFHTYTGSGVFSGIKTGIIKDTGEYVFAKTGKNYTGKVYNSVEWSNLGYGMYTNLNHSGSYGRVSIECPCEPLIFKTVYDAISNNKGSIDINTNEHSQKIFVSAWFYMLSRKYAKSIDMYLSIIKYYMKLSRSINGANLNSSDFDDMRMTYINLGHAYLLSGNLDKAKQYYTDKMFSTDFGESYGNLSKSDVLKLDWDDFISHGLITKHQIEDFNNKHRILN